MHRQAYGEGVRRTRRVHISTSLVEGEGLTMRMGMRGFIRLTNGFIRPNPAAADSLRSLHHSLAWPHQTLTKAADGYPTSPAIAAGIANHADPDPDRRAARLIEI